MQDIFTVTAIHIRVAGSRATSFVHSLQTFQFTNTASVRKSSVINASVHPLQSIFS